MRLRHRSPAKVRSLLGSLKVTSENSLVDGDRLLRSVATDLFESLNTPVALSCEILLRYNDFEQLCSKKIDPLVYNDPIKFRDDYQAVSFLKKTPFRKVGLDPKAAATAKFYEAEEQCRCTNLRIRNFLVAPERASDVVRKAFGIAGRKIQDVLGSLDYREWLYSCRFGPGVFNSPVHRGLTSIYDKLQVTPSVTNDFGEAGAILVTSSPQWARSISDSDVDGFWPFVKKKDLLTVPGNRVTFVPKTAITDRAIAIEPLLNIYAQLGLGTMLRRRLKRVGVNLDDQTDNQSFALWGSLDGSLCTIDLSSASDTVAKELIRSLFPEDWFRALDITRSKTGELDGTIIRYEKFSSMGNGFTFELESLVFWALSVAACEISNTSTQGLKVYGDDIVVPLAAYDILGEILSFFGFSLNRAKSFKEGYFRESCGKDYFDGVDVRPFFVKEVPERVHTLFGLANGIRRCAHRRRNLIGCDGRLHLPWRRVVQAIPRSLANNVRVPAHAGDSDGIVSNWDEAQRSPFVIPSRDGWEGYFGLRYQASPVRVREVNNFNGAIASLLYRLGDGPVDEYSPAFPRQGRDFVYQLRDGAFYGPWTELGPWLTN